MTKPQTSSHHLSSAHHTISSHDLLPSNRSLPKEKFDELEAYIDNLETTKGALIEILHKAQQIFGYLPRDLQLCVARKLGMPGAEVFGVVSFYSYFTTEPRGKHSISVCLGTACFIKGAGKILLKLKETLGIESNEITEDGLFTLKEVRCLGTCGMAPVMMIDDRVFGHVQEEDLAQILNAYRPKEGKDSINEKELK